MKALLISLLLVFISACSTTQVVPVKRYFPEIPNFLKEKCKTLTTINEDQVVLSKLLSVVVDNYAKYHECSLKNDSWIEWYDAQKQIYESVDK